MTQHSVPKMFRTFGHQNVPEHSNVQIVTFCHDYVSDHPEVLLGGVGDAGSPSAPASHPSRGSRTETTALREVHSEKKTGQRGQNIQSSLCL